MVETHRALADAALQNDLGRIHAEARYMDTRRDHGVSDSDLHVLIAQSGLSEAQFAREVLARDPRTVRRWLTGAHLPNLILAWLSRVRSATVTRNVIRVVIDRHDRRAARQHWPVKQRSNAEREDDEADRSAQDAFTAYATLATENMVAMAALVRGFGGGVSARAVADVRLRCVCGLMFTNALIALDHAAGCEVRRAMPGRADAQAAPAPTDVKALTSDVVISHDAEIVDET